MLLKAIDLEFGANKDTKLQRISEVLTTTLLCDSFFFEVV
jgi:hypothetical protein